MVFQRPPGKWSFGKAQRWINFLRLKRNKAFSHIFRFWVHQNVQCKKTGVRMLWANLRGRRKADEAQTLRRTQHKGPNRGPIRRGAPRPPGVLNMPVLFVENFIFITSFLAHHRYYGDRQGVRYSDDFSLAALTKFCTSNSSSKKIWLITIKLLGLQAFQPCITLLV